MKKHRTPSEYTPVEGGRRKYVVANVAIWDALFFDAMIKTHNPFKRAMLLRVWTDRTATARESDFDLVKDKQIFERMRTDFEKILQS